MMTTHRVEQSRRKTFLSVNMFLRMSMIGSVKSNLHFTSAFIHAGRCLPSPSFASHGHHRGTSCRAFHRSIALDLNRFLFDPCEVDSDTTAVIAMDDNDNDDDDRSRSGKLRDDDRGGGIPTVTLPKDDYRTVHAAKILGLLNGDTLRAGIVQDRENGEEQRAQDQNLAGLVTDRASIKWLPEGKIKKAQPTKNGDPPGSLRITLHSLISPEQLEHHDDDDGGNHDGSIDADSTTGTTTQTSESTSEAKRTEQTTGTAPATSTPHVSLILAVPRPLGLSRLLPMISQLGVDHLILTTARKVPKDYFGSHLLREPQELRRLLIEGLCQAGDVRIPKVTVVKRLKPFLEDELEGMFPTGGKGGRGYTRVIAHPERKGEDGDGLGKVGRMRDVVLASNSGGEGGTIKNIVLAVGPEGGWDEPFELDMFRQCGFEQITLGTRILRTDVAVVSLLSLAHDSLCATKGG